jgi:hypothetical protein
MQKHTLLFLSKGSCSSRSGCSPFNGYCWQEACCLKPPVTAAICTCTCGPLSMTSKRSNGNALLLMGLTWSTFKQALKRKWIYQMVHMHGGACSATNAIWDHIVPVMGFSLSYLLFIASQTVKGTGKRQLLCKRSSPALVKFLLRISLSDVLKKLAVIHNIATLSDRRKGISASHYGPTCITSSAQYESHH